MAELHERLTALAAEARWPATPDLAARVRGAIEADPAPAARSLPRSRRPLLAALLALLVGGGGALAAPGVGSDVLDALGLRNATVTKFKRLPPTALGGRLALGERYTLGAAARVAGFALLQPVALGAPAEVYVDEGVVTFAYRDRRGQPILFTQVPGSAGRYVQKFVTADTRRVRIAGTPGLLLRGRHAVIFDPRDGRPRVQEARLAKNTLMWERGGLLLRLEAEQPARELVRLARSVRAAARQR